MAAHTKMIIITSNEDLIRQFTSSKNTNTHIIDFDNNNKPIPSSTNDDNNTINLDLLAQLTELNSTNDQVYKRALNLPHQKRSKPVKTWKKSDNLICNICGDRAIGFNYDVLSCGSCRAFFRRNANQPLGKIKCLTGQGKCSTAHGERRKCPRCRLDRCLALGMKKDYILSEEDKQRRQKILEENRNMASKFSSTAQSLPNTESTLDDIDKLLMGINENEDNIVANGSTNSNLMEDVMLETLSIEDWVAVQSIQSSFLSAFQIPPEEPASIDLTDQTSASITFSQHTIGNTLRFINFIRHIDEFEGLHADDRFILIKYNLLALFPISKCFCYKPVNDICFHGQNEQEEKHQLFFSFDDSNNVHTIFKKLVFSLVELTGQDSTLLSLLLTALMFSQGLSMNKDEPPLQDPLAVNRAQSYYTTLLWNYLVNKWGEIQSWRFFTKLLTVIFRMQSATKIFRDFCLMRFTTPDTVDKLEPLLQTILNIS